jgi:TPR repeat protein
MGRAVTFSLLVGAFVAFWENPLAAAPSSVAACDRLAAAPWDPDATQLTKPVEFRDLDADPAIVACRDAVAQAPHLRRLLFQLGRAYDRRGLNQDAYVSYRAASLLGSGAAMVNIGILFRQGRRFEKNEVKARDWFRNAARSGIPEGMYCYATALDNGLGGPADSSEALSWYKKAAKRGVAKARDPLVRLQIEGAGTGAICD